MCNCRIDFAYRSDAEHRNVSNNPSINLQTFGIHECGQLNQGKHKQNTARWRCLLPRVVCNSR